MKTVQERYVDVMQANNHRHLSIRTTIEEAFLLGAVSGFGAGSENDLETIKWITYKLAERVSEQL